MSPVARVMVWAIRGYRRGISPLFGAHCRFHPTCSMYALTAITVHGAGRGTWLSIKRIARCHPWNPGGIDPVPEAMPGLRAPGIHRHHSQEH